MHSSALASCLLFCLSCFCAITIHAQSATPFCGTPDSTLVKYLIKHSQRTDLTRARASAGERLQYRVALNIGYATYLRCNQDKEWIKNAAYKFIEEASQIFEREINVKLTVSTILIWDNPEPYQLVNDFDYYDKVYNYWLQNRTDRRDVLVNLADGLGTYWGGGRMCTSNFLDPDYPLKNVDILCHELGHTLGSPHTHSCYWPGGPIDYCTTSEGCEGYYKPTEAVNGSIMSYCRSVLSFHPLCRNLMRDYADGKVDPSFKLNAVDTPPALSGSLLLRDPNAQATSNNPAFEWEAPVSTGIFRFQISKNAGFTDVAEDTLVRQSYFRSAGLGEGKYYARLNVSNATGTSAWSQILPFSVSPFSENSTSPALYEAIRQNDGTITGYFKKYSDTDVYQVEAVNYYSGNQPILHQVNMTESNIQNFSLPLNTDVNGTVRIRIRVGKGQKWSKWSDNRILTEAWNSELLGQTNLEKVSGSPILAFYLYRPGLINHGTPQSIEIATDQSFANIILKDSVLTNQMNDWYTNKAVFNPTLEENKSYFVRTRVNHLSGYSKWKTYAFSTGQADQRFEFLGLASKNLQSLSWASSEFQPVKFYKSGTQLYIQSVIGGYYASSDLKTWQQYTTSSTKGLLPSYSNLLAISSEGQSYLFDQNGTGTLVENNQNGGTRSLYLSASYFYIPRLTPGWILKNDGVIFRTENSGIAHFKAGEWRFYKEETFQSHRSMYLAANSVEQLWNVMEGGRVWSFKNSSWTEEPFFADWAGLKGINFDKNNTPYLYGDFGVVKLNENRHWEIIPALSGLPIRKVVFDNKGQMWATAFQHNGLAFTTYALIKLNGQKTSIYSDGLNFLKEPFDIEFFKDKLVILTSGGEIHTFDETRIQRFDATLSYCAGNEVSVTLNSNSSFPAQNQMSLLLTNVSNGNTTKITDVTVVGNKITGRLPAGLDAGSYKMQTITTQPELISNESDVFQIFPNPDVTISKVESNSFTVKLETKANVDLTYQWLKDGIAIPGETSPSLNVGQSGNYTLSGSPGGGCISISNPLQVQIDGLTEITLLQSTPNPMLSSTEIALYLPHSENISLELFNQKGQKVREMGRGVYTSGWHLFSVTGNDFPSGVYVYRLTAGKVTKSLKFVKL
jgi:hypothetical protein